jgi:hypothetical protein
MRDDAYTFQNLSEALQDFVLHQLPGRNHLGWVLGPGILEAIGFPRLQGLNPAMKVASHDLEPDQALLF